MASNVTKAKIDEEVCANALKFANLYKDSADLRRNLINILYTADEPLLIYNGNLVNGIQKITDFWNALPETRHDLSFIDAHPIGADVNSLVCQIMGNVTMGGQCRAYNQVLLLVREDGNYKIKSDTYRLME